jgi:taurine dioxygenase
LLGYIYAPDNLYEHHWRTGDLIVWNNLALQHSRARVETDAPRTLRRLVLTDPGSDAASSYRVAS